MYKEFFQELKKLIIELDLLDGHFELKDRLGWCTIEEVERLEEKIGKLPLAYKEYLLSIGKNYLFGFFNGANYFFEAKERRKELAEEILAERGLSKTSNRFKRRYFEIGNGREDDYFAYIYLDEKEDPLVWIVPASKKEKIEHADRFTEIIISCFQFSLMNKPVSIEWGRGITSEHLAKFPNYPKDQLRKFQERLHSVNEYIESRTDTNNKLVLVLYESFQETYKAYKGNTEKRETPDQEEIAKEKQDVVFGLSKKELAGLILFLVVLLVLLKLLN